MLPNGNPCGAVRFFLHHAAFRVRLDARDGTNRRGGRIGMKQQCPSPHGTAEVTFMVMSLRRLLRRLLFILLFVLLTLAVSSAFRLLAGWLRMPDPHAVPQGQAVRVSVPDAAVRPFPASAADRLRLFYLTGE